MANRHRVALVFEDSFAGWRSFLTPAEANAFAEGVCEGAEHYGAGSAWAVVWDDEQSALKQDKPEAYADAVKALEELEAIEAGAGSS